MVPPRLKPSSEVSLGGCFVLVSAGVSDVGVSSEAFDEVPYVGDLVQLAEHEGPEVPFGVVFYGSSGSFGVKVCLEGWMDGN